MGTATVVRKAHLNAVCVRYYRQVADWRVLIPVLISPAALFCLVSAQSSFLTGAMMPAIFAWLDRRPIQMGVLIGLLTIKPRLGILFPFMLIASGRWRVFAAITVTALELVGVTTVIFGGQVWLDFISKGLPVQHLVLADPDRIATPFFPTMFVNLRGLDFGYAIAMSVQAAVSACARDLPSTRPCPDRTAGCRLSPDQGMDWA